MKALIVLIALSIMMYPKEMRSQTDSSLLFPTQVNGSVKQLVSAIPKYSTEKGPGEYLSVFVKQDSNHDNTNAVQGTYRVDGDYLTFTPYFPFESGMTYVARVKNTDEDGRYSNQSFQVGTKPTFEAAKVTGIYPLAAELPENLLRFYIYFNTPMKKGQALSHIQLVDAAGNSDTKAFMEFKQELWSADGKRLTILFDPGRIKRGVSTNVELGPALLEGKHYQLTISGAWQDVYGQNLAIKASKAFEVVDAYREQIAVKELEILHPKENSFDAFTVSFNRIMDHALVQSMIRIEAEDGQPVAGHWEASKDETSALFFPAQAWKKGRYQLILNGHLEDVSGNNLNNLLDQKLNAETQINAEELIREFTISSSDYFD